MISLQKYVIKGRLEAKTQVKSITIGTAWRGEGWRRHFQSKKQWPCLLVENGVQDEKREDLDGTLSLFSP
jgi:hypothetical protein